MNENKGTTQAPLRLMSRLGKKLTRKISSQKVTEEEDGKGVDRRLTREEEDNSISGDEMDSRQHVVEYEISPIIISSLHEACMHYPTVSMIENIVAENPLAPYELNEKGQSPLHVAAEKGASPQVINYLLKINPYAACEKDGHERSPLHLACGNCGLCDTGMRNGNCSRDLRKGPFYPAIKALFQAAPEMVNDEDIDGCCPVEIAICSNMPMKAVRSLQKVSENAWQGVKTAPVDGSSVEHSCSSTRISHLGMSRFSQLHHEGQKQNSDSKEKIQCRAATCRTSPNRRFLAGAA